MSSVLDWNLKVWSFALSLELYSGMKLLSIIIRNGFLNLLRVFDLFENFAPDGISLQSGKVSDYYQGVLGSGYGHIDTSWVL